MAQRGTLCYSCGRHSYAFQEAPSITANAQAANPMLSLGSLEHAAIGSHTSMAEESVPESPHYVSAPVSLNSVRTPSKGGGGHVVF